MIADTQARHYPLLLIRVGRVALFAALLAISAKIRIELGNTPIPITAQTLVVFITGMVLGPVEGAISVAAYVGAIALGAPLDTRGLGPAVFATPTAGYLIGFIPGALIAGLAWRSAERYRLALNILCGLLSAAVILACGTAGTALLFHLPWGTALVAGVFPFILTEPGKVLLAAALVKLGDEARLRWLVGSALPK